MINPDLSVITEEKPFMPGSPGLTTQATFIDGDCVYFISFDCLPDVTLISSCSYSRVIKPMSHKRSSNYFTHRPKGSNAI